MTAVKPRKLVVVILIGVLADAAAAQAAQAIAPDAALWAEIEALAKVTATSQPIEQRQQSELRRLSRLTERTAAYLRNYPGGTHRDDAIQFELSAWFELGALRGGRFDDLRARAADYAARPPSPAAEHEAAYWLLFCERLTAADARETPRDMRQLDAEQAAAFARYVERYPSSRHTPRLAELAFAAAEARADAAEMARLSRLLDGHYQQHSTAEYLRGRLKRHAAIGQPLRFEGVSENGPAVSTDALRGGRGLLVVWAAWDAASREQLEEIRRYQSQHRDVKVITLRLDLPNEGLMRTGLFVTTSAPASASTSAPATALTSAPASAPPGTAEPNWPTDRDPRGRAAAFALEWGIRRLPCVFVLDAEGRLVAVAEGSEWRAATGSR